MLIEGGKGSPATAAGAATGRSVSTDMWEVTHGEAQYRWLKKTLEESKAKYKFVFAHHVLGTSRGAVEMADLYEWGGRNADGVWEFDKKRPNWDLPIHQLMAKYGVSIFFRGTTTFLCARKKMASCIRRHPTPPILSTARPLTGSALPTNPEIIVLPRDTSA
jgi:hypothetical protein